MNQRELEELAESAAKECGTFTTNRILVGARAQIILAALQRAIESAVEKACKALAADDFRASDCDPGYTHAQWVIRRAFSPASPAEEKRQEVKP